MLSPTLLGVIHLRHSSNFGARTRRQRVLVSGWRSFACRPILHHSHFGSSSVFCSMRSASSFCATCSPLGLRRTRRFCARADDCAPTRKRALERAVLSVARSACELHCIRALCDARRQTGHPSRQDISSRRDLAFVFTRFILSMLLDGAIIYVDLTLQTPNQAMQRTAGQRAASLSMTTTSPFQMTLALGGGG